MKSLYEIKSSNWYRYLIAERDIKEHKAPGFLSFSKVIIAVTSPTVWQFQLAFAKTVDERVLSAIYYLYQINETSSGAGKNNLINVNRYDGTSI